jgi:hypothetical protein
MARVALLVALSLLASPVFAQGVPIDVQTQLICKIVSMDRNFSRFGSSVRIGVTSDRLAESFSAVKDKMQIKGRSIEVEKSGTADVAKFNVVVIDENWKDRYATASEAATRSKALSFFCEESALTGFGGAVSFRLNGAKAKIVINLTNVKAQGSLFSADLLQLAIVVG